MSRRYNTAKSNIDFCYLWNIIGILNILCSFIYVFFEWLFIVTKPSFMNRISLYQQIEVLLFSIGILVLFSFLVNIPFIVFTKIIIRSKIFKDIIILLIPTFMISSCLFLLFDNFLYTIFHVGIISAKGIIIFAYGILYIGFSLFSYSKVKVFRNHLETKEVPLVHGRFFSLIIFLTLLTLSTIIAIKNHAINQKTNSVLINPKVQEIPNILWITTDGLDAESMSLYGYSRVTTPNIDHYAQSMLIFENAFSNAGNTTGSVISMLTGKYPSVTRVLHPPDILWGSNSYEHLPGILSENGYFTAQITMRYYADAYELNLKDGFLYANYRQPYNGSFLIELLSNNLPAEYYLFITEIWNRLFDRLGYIFWGKESINPFDFLMNYDQQVDEKAINKIMQYINLAKETPWFIEAHLLGTHGPTFNISHQDYSKGLNRYKQEYWNEDFYDDSIVEFDKNIGKILNELEGLQILDKTLVIIGSDHGSQWDQTKRIPLLIRFPNSSFKGRIKNNVSYIDISPTILDFLKIDIPNWMNGESLLSENLKNENVIGFTVSGLDVYENRINTVNPVKISPPFYQFGEISLINCDKWYKLVLSERILSSGLVEGSTMQCSLEEQMTPQEVFQYLVQRLENDGFDTSLLKSSKFIHINNE